MDRYDEQIAVLTEHPDLIQEHWRGDSGLFASTGCNIYDGCLTQIRHSKAFSVPGRPDLTKKIRADMRLPDSPFSITVESLPAFAEWQRILNKELGRC